ncbi:MAG: PorP/SprF family type IX secretion system membrane protein [Chitinophagales bacterium]
MTKLCKLSLILATFLFGSTLYAQDVHFSQFNSNPIYLNPALSGLNNCNYRLAANYKRQWGGVANFQTIAASYDMNMLKRNRKSNFAGFGISLFNDRAGDISLSNTKVDISLAYSLVLNPSGTQFLTFALKGGVGHRSFDMSKVTTDSQFGADGFNSGLSTQENFATDSKVYGDVGAGLLWSLTQRNSNNYYLGFAVTHLNQPNISFFNDRDEQLYIKATLHGGASFKLNNQLGLMPSFMFLNQGPHNQLNVGGLVKIRKSIVPSDQTAFYIGGWYRLQDAVILSARVDWKDINIGFSYDINLSKLTPATNLNGGPEVSLIYTGCLSNKKNQSVYCPAL